MLSLFKADTYLISSYILHEPQNKCIAKEEDENNIIETIFIAKNFQTLASQKFTVLQVVPSSSNALSAKKK